MRRPSTVDGAANFGEWSPEGTFYVLEPPSPDLVVTTLETTGSPTMNPDESIAVPIRVVVQNQGDAAAAVFKVSTEYTGPEGTFTVPFTVPGQDSAFYPYTGSSLGPGNGVTFEGEVTLPDTVGAETVSLRAIADSCAGDELMPDYCRVEERDEANNLSASISVSLPGPVALELTPVADSYVEELNFWQNYGGASTLKVDLEDSYRHRSLIRFDLSSVPVGAAVQTAGLRLYLTDGNYGTDVLRVGVVQILEEWTETGVYWDDRPSTAWPDFEDSLLVGESAGTYYWNLDSLVQEWVGGTANYGIMLYGKEDSAYDAWRAFASRESGNPPQLLVEYIITD